MLLHNPHWAVSPCWMSIPHPKQTAQSTYTINLMTHKSEYTFSFRGEMSSSHVNRLITHRFNANKIVLTWSQLISQSAMHDPTYVLQTHTGIHTIENKQISVVLLVCMAVCMLIFLWTRWTDGEKGAERTKKKHKEVVVTVCTLLFSKDAFIWSRAKVNSIIM